MAYILPVSTNNFLLPGNPGFMQPQNFAVPQGLICYYGMGLDCTSINTVYDISGNGIYGTYLGTTLPFMTKVAGPWGTALNLNGAGYIDLGSANVTAKFPMGSSPRTICAWVYITNYTNYKFICAYGAEGVNGQDLQFYIRITTGSLVVDYYGGAIDSGLVVPTNRWSHVVFSFPGGTANEFFYLNYASKSTGSLNTPNTQPGVDHHIGLISGNTVFSDMIIADWRVYNRCLSDSEVLELYNAGLRGLRFSSAWQYEMPVLFVPAAPPPSILYGQNIAAHYNWQIAPMEYQ